MTSIFVAIPIPPPDRWIFVRDPEELPDGYMIAAGLHRPAGAASGALTVPAPRLEVRPTFVFWARDPRDATQVPLACESRQLAERVTLRISEIIEIAIPLQVSR